METQRHREVTIFMKVIYFLKSNYKILFNFFCYKNICVCYMLCHKHDYFNLGKLKPDLVPGEFLDK